jgi:hypothetical protein
MFPMNVNSTSHINKNIVKELIIVLDEKINNQTLINEVRAKIGCHESDFDKKYKKISQIRNEFVHGNWAALKPKLDEIGEVELFKTIQIFLEVYDEFFHKLDLIHK